MKLAIVSDIHCHQFSEFATIENGINSRLMASISIVSQVEKYSTENGIKDIIFCGDMFHTRPSVDTLTFNLVIKRIIESANKGFNWYILPGNHDCYSKDDKYHSLQILENIPNVTVLSTKGKNITSKKINDINLIGVKYDDNIDTTKKYIREAKKEKTDGTNILLLHTEIKNSKTPTGYTFESGINSKILSRDFDFTFCGHIHKLQKFYDNVYNVGSPLHQDWGDKWSKKGFLVLDTESKEIKQIKTKYPEFREIDEIEYATYKGDTYNFYKIKFDSTLTEDKIKEIKNDFKFVILDYTIKVESSKRSSITLDMSWDKIIHEYVNNTDTALNKKELNKIGQALLKDVL